MSERYTSKDAHAAFERLAEAAGARIADPDWKISDPRRQGAWFLDSNPTYGGYVIGAYVTSSPPRDGDTGPQTYTAETCPLGYGRRPAREFSQMCHFAARAIAFAKQDAR